MMYDNVYIYIYIHSSHPFCRYVSGPSHFQTREGKLSRSGGGKVVVRKPG